jgi:Trypsin-like peptidase domain/TPR repeat
MHMSTFFSTAAFFGTTLIIVQPAVQAKSAIEVGRIAKAITLEINRVGSNNGGSGILLQRQGDLYTVLTARHVVDGSSSFNLKTSDGKVHKVISNSIRSDDGSLDLAILKFRSNNPYALAKIGTSNSLENGSILFVAGFPKATYAVGSGDLNFTKGEMIGNATKGNKGGYSLMYSNITRPGMSGGPVLNEDGELVAIHGLGDREGDSGEGDKTGRNLGIVIERFRKFALAIGLQLDQQIAILPTNQTVNAVDYLITALDIGSEGNYQGAIVEVNKAISLDPKLALAYAYRGHLRTFQNNPNEALSDLNKAIALDPKSPKAYSLRGILKNDKLGDPNGALADYNQAIALDPKYAEAYVNRGLVKNNKLNDKIGGLADVNTAIAIDPDLAPAYVIRSYMIGDRASAIRDKRKAAQLFRKQKRIQYLQRVVEELRQLGATEIE